MFQSKLSGPVGSKLIGPVGFMARGDQRPPYYTPVYLPRLERSLRRDQPWPVDIVRNVRQDDVIVVLRPMLDEVLDALDARGAATPSFTLVSVNYDDAVTPQLRQRIGATRAIRRAFAQNLMAGPRDDKIHPLPLGLPLCGQQPPRGFGRLQHAPPAPDQAQGGLQSRLASASPGQPRPAPANRQIYSGWPAIPVSFPPRLSHAPTRAH